MTTTKQYYLHGWQSHKKKEEWQKNGMINNFQNLILQII